MLIRRSIYSLANIKLLQLITFAGYFLLFIVLAVQAMAARPTFPPVWVALAVPFYASAFATVAASSPSLVFSLLVSYILTVDTATMRWTLSAASITLAIVFGTLALSTVAAIEYLGRLLDRNTRFFGLRVVFVSLMMALEWTWGI